MSAVATSTALPLAKGTSVSATRSGLADSHQDAPGRSFAARLHQALDGAGDSTSNAGSPGGSGAGSSAAAPTTAAPSKSTDKVKDSAADAAGQTGASANPAASTPQTPAALPGNLALNVHESTDWGAAGGTASVAGGSLGSAVTGVVSSVGHGTSVDPTASAQTSVAVTTGQAGTAAGALADSQAALTPGETSAQSTNALATSAQQSATPMAAAAAKTVAGAALGTPVPSTGSTPLASTKAASTVLSGTVLSGTVLSGPVSPGTVLSGSVLSGPVSPGTVLSGTVGSTSGSAASSAPTPLEGDISGAAVTLAASDASAASAVAADAGVQRKPSDAVVPPVPTAELNTLTALGHQTPTLNSVSAPVQAPAPVAAVPTAAPLTEQLSRPIFQLATGAGGTQVMTVQVVPDSLGPVTVRAHLAGDGVRIELLAATDAGRDGLRLILNDLKRDLAAQGVSSTMELSSSLNDGGAPGRQQAFDRGGPVPFGGSPGTRNPEVGRLGRSPQGLASSPQGICRTQLDITV